MAAFAPVACACVLDGRCCVFCRNLMSLAFAGGFAVAACPAAAESLSLEAAVRRTLERNPALQAESLTVGALESQALLDGLKPAPVLGADLENVLGTGALSGVHSAEATLRLSQVIELGGKREARRMRGRADIDKQLNVVRQRQLDLAAETTRRYIEVRKGQDELALARRQEKLVRETEAAVRQRVDRGVAQEADQSLAQIAVVRAEIALEHAEHELASARFSLAALWGANDAPEIEVTGDLLALPPIPELAALAARLPQTPEANAFELDANRIAAERALAMAAARPDVSVSLGVRRLEALDDQGLVLSFGMPLGTAARSSLAVARTDAERASLDARAAAALLDTQQKLFARYQELRHARTEFEAVGARMIPAAEKALALTQAGYDDARYSILQLTQAQAIVLQLLQEQLAAAARYHQLLADIERSTAASGETP